MEEKKKKKTRTEQEKKKQKNREKVMKLTSKISKVKSQRHLNNSNEDGKGSGDAFMEGTSEQRKISLEINNKMKPNLE